MLYLSSPAKIFVTTRKRRMRKTPLLLISLASLVWAVPIVVSDGPTDTPKISQAKGPKKIITTDGPAAWTQAEKNGVHLYGQWVVVSEGPGTQRIIGAPADPHATPFPAPVFAKSETSAPKSIAVAAPAASPQKIVISDGPGTTPVAHAKKKTPVVEAETSTLAPMIPTKTQAVPLPPAIQAPRPAAVQVLPV